MHLVGMVGMVGMVELIDFVELVSIHTSMLVFTHGSLVFTHGSFTRLFLLKISRLAVSVCRGWLTVSVYLHDCICIFAFVYTDNILNSTPLPLHAYTSVSLLVFTRDVPPGLHS